jgi:hypothetical protein
VSPLGEFIALKFVILSSLNDLRKLVSLRWNKIYEGHLTWLLKEAETPGAVLFMT